MKKPIDGIILAIKHGKGGPREEESDDSESDSMDSADAMAEELVSAMKDKDQAGVLDALEALHEIFHKRMDEE